MDAFSSSPLAESFPCDRFDSPAISPAASPSRTEVDFPADVDQSFNSSMSFSINDSPPAPSPSMHLGKAAVTSLLNSPTPLLRVQRRADMSLSYSALGTAREGETSRVRVRPLGASRTFGRELSLNTTRLPGPAQPMLKGKAKLLPPAAAAAAVVPEYQRPVSPVRLHHTTSHEDMSSPKLLLPRMGRRESAPTLESPLPPPRAVGLLPSPMDDGMDVDSPRPVRIAAHQSPSFGSPGLGSFFCESPVVPALSLAKRRALASSSPASPSSSPSTRRPRSAVDKGSCSGLLFGAGSRSNSVAARRSAMPYKRPPLNVHPVADTQRPEHTSSAYPILCGPAQQRNSFPSMRRAFSVSEQPPMAEDTEDESEIDRSPSVNPAAEYRRRYGVPPNPRINGSPGFARPIRSSISTVGEVTQRPPQVQMEAPKRSPLPELHDEVRGKILPCHKSPHDQLMRITVDTLRDVLDGRYTARMKQYHILDCRFDYEYDGGHISGAINVRDEGHLDELLLSASLGLNKSASSLPAPSCSGELDCEQQVVLIFHCEYSAHRAPTVATKFRHRDRKLNNDFYPKVHYPEIYILDGGYCDFFKSCPTQCEPEGYVEMKDPAHQERCDTGMAHFRRFNRARSYTYGELQQSNRSRYRSHHSADQTRDGPPGMGSLMAAASAALGRRGNSGTTNGRDGTAISEEREPESSPSGASPCPRALSMGQAPIFGSARPRTLDRSGGFQRFASCADAMVRR